MNIERAEELKNAICMLRNTGKQLSEDDLYGTEQVLQELIDAELARPTSEDVEMAIKNLDVVEGAPCPTDKTRILAIAALRAYKQPRVEETAGIDLAIIEASYRKLKIAVGYAESIENSDDYQTALDMMKDAALRSYKQPKPEDAQEAIAELSKWMHYHHGFELNVAGYIPPDPEVGVTAKTFGTIATALRRMKG